MQTVFSPACSGRVSKITHVIIWRQISHLYGNKESGYISGFHKHKFFERKASSVEFQHILTLLRYWVQRQSENDMVVNSVPSETYARSLYSEIKHRCFENRIILHFEKYQSNDRRKNAPIYAHPRAFIKCFSWLHYNPLLYN